MKNARHHVKQPIIEMKSTWPGSRDAMKGEILAFLKKNQDALTKEVVTAFAHESGPAGVGRFSFTTHIGPAHAGQPDAIAEIAASAVVNCVSRTSYRIGQVDLQFYDVQCDSV
ncbi:hypothetical protein [Candidatus Binatus sp.]|uniref:hypothetical protein n=1 Tax=Candidatus Binatus sp. TaxID=2811406 RepID=UPI003C631D13